MNERIKERERAMERKREIVIGGVFLVLLQAKYKLLCGEMWLRVAEIGKCGEVTRGKSIRLTVMLML